MGLNNGQRDDIRNFLLSRGLALKPLLDEMSDHIGCDLENLMNDGLSYEDAWKQTINQLPEDHFRQIQKETMETINQRFTLSRVFTYVALASLFIGAVFKAFHLAGYGQLMLASFVAMAVSLVAGSVSGIYLNRDKDGAMRIVGLVIGTVLMMIGYSFKILHLPGADQIIILAVLTTVVFMFINAIHAYRSGHENLFTFLHAKYTPGIERFLLLLVMPILFSRMVAIVLVYAAGLQFVALMWRNMYESQAQRNIVNLVGIVVASICLVTPMLANIVPLEPRLAAVVLFSFVGAFLSLKEQGVLQGRFEQSHRLSSYLVLIAPIMFTLTSAVKMGWIGSLANNIPLHVIVCVAIVAGIFLSPKHSVMRTFMILSLGYLLEL